MIPSRKIRDGAELARDVVAGPPGTAPLLRAGVKLSARYADLLPKAGVGSVWIEDALASRAATLSSLNSQRRRTWNHRFDMKRCRESGPHSFDTFRGCLDLGAVVACDGNDGHTIHRLQFAP